MTLFYLIYTNLEIKYGFSINRQQQKENMTFSCNIIPFLGPCSYWFNDNIILFN